MEHRLRNSPIISCLINGCWSLFKWGLFLTVVAALLVLVAGVYIYLGLDDQVRRQVELKLAQHYPQFQVHVGKARIEKGRGIAVYDLSLTERSKSGPTQPIISIDELLLAGDTRVENLVAGKPRFDKIVVRRPRLRAARLSNGAWNVQALWPLPKFSDDSPEFQIDEATLVLEDAARPSATPLTLRGAELKLTPKHSVMRNGKPARAYQVTGSASGAPAREMTFGGVIQLDDGTMDLTISVRSLDVSPELVVAVPGPTPICFNQFHLYGRADATIHLARSAPATPIAWSIDASLHRGHLDCSQIPQSLTDLSAKLHADPQRLIVPQLTAKLGAADVAFAVQRNGWTENSPVALAGKVSGLILEPQLFAKMPSGPQRLWQRFRPTGPVDAEVRATFDGRQWQPELTVECRGITLTDNERFPYPLEQATGTVKLHRSPTNDGMELALDLTAIGDKRPIQIAAVIDNIPTPTCDATPPGAPVVATASPFTGTITVSGSGVPIHEQLLAALPDKVQSFVRSLSPQGMVDFAWRLDRRDQAQETADTSLDLTLSDCAIQYGPFPYPLQHIRGQVTARNNLWTLHDLQGQDRQGVATVTCEGQSLSEAAGQRLQLVFQAANVPLDENLKQSLSPQVQKVWAELRPEGRVDFTANVSRDPGQAKPAILVDIRPHEQTVSIEPQCFPYRLERLDGRALVTDGKVELQHWQAHHGRSNVGTEGTWQSTPDGGWQLVLSDLNADRLATDPELLRALPPPVQKVIDRLRPTGTFDLHRSTFSFTRHDESAPVASAWDVQLAFPQASLHGDLPLENISGGVRLMGSCNGPKCASYGELAIDSLIWNDIQLTDIRGPFWADDTLCLFGQSATEKLGQPGRRITAQAYGGTLAVDAQLQHAGHPRYHIDLALGAAEMSRIVSERLGGPKDVTGIVSGKLRLDGAGHSIYALNGNGDLHVVDANIYKLPFLVSLLKVLSNRLPDTTAFDRCDLVFDIHGENVHFQQLNLVGDAVSLYGRGEANFDRQLNLEFYSLVGPGGLSVPLLSAMVGQASRQILQLKVSGALDNPQIHREAFPAVGEMLEEIRQGGAAAATVPAAAGLPLPFMKK